MYQSLYITGQSNTGQATAIVQSSVPASAFSTIISVTASAFPTSVPVTFSAMLSTIVTALLTISSIIMAIVVTATLLRRTQTPLATCTALWTVAQSFAPFLVSLRTSFIRCLLQFHTYGITVLS